MYENAELRLTLLSLILTPSDSKLCVVGRASPAVPSMRSKIPVRTDLYTRSGFIL